MVYVKIALDEGGEKEIKGTRKCINALAGNDDWQEAFWARVIGEMKAAANALGCDQYLTEGEYRLKVTPKRYNRKVEWSFTFED